MAPVHDNPQLIFQLFVGEFVHAYLNPLTQGSKLEDKIKKRFMDFQSGKLCIIGLGKMGIQKWIKATRKGLKNHGKKDYSTS